MYWSSTKGHMERTGIQPAHLPNISDPIGAAGRCSTALSTALQYLDDVVNLSNIRKEKLVPP